MAEIELTKAEFQRFVSEAHDAGARDALTAAEGLLAKLREQIAPAALAPVPADTEEEK